MKLLPLPAGLKKILLRMVTASGLDRMSIAVNVGNLAAVGYKAADGRRR
jgi:hypothetical protein